MSVFSFRVTDRDGVAVFARGFWGRVGVPNLAVGSSPARRQFVSFTCGSISMYPYLSQNWMASITVGSAPSPP